MTDLDRSRTTPRLIKGKCRYGTDRYLIATKSK
jgi:hypothetical protein